MREAIAARQPGAQVRDRVPQEVVSAISAVAVIAHKESRHPVQKNIDTINAWLYAARPAQGIDPGQLRAQAEQWKRLEYAFSYEGNHAQRATGACRADLLDLIDGQRDTARGVGNG